MIKISSLRHGKETGYVTIMMVLGGIVWGGLVLVTGGFAILFAIPFAFVAWIMGLYFKAVVYGESVKVTADQYPELHNIVQDQAQKLNLSNPPTVLIYNGHGMVNAFALKFLAKSHVILMSDLVDLMLKRDKKEELSMIIGHELGHHAAGHTSTFKNLLIKPATYIPFIGAAYSRACELTADRVGYALTQDLESSQKALVAIAHGSESLANDTNIDAFAAQDKEIPDLMGFIHKLFSTHPRMTSRVIELTKYAKTAPAQASPGPESQMG